MILICFTIDRKMLFAHSMIVILNTKRTEITKTNLETTTKQREKNRMVKLVIFHFLLTAQQQVIS